MEYYFTAAENIKKDSLHIVGEESEHIFKVLRRKENEILFVTDGEYNVYKCRIDEMGKYDISCTILEKHYRLNEPDIKITLYPALLRNHDRFEFIIEKAVEIGVYEIFPVITDRVMNKEWNKRDRWQAIAKSAMKQSQRCYLPYVNEPCTFDVIKKEIDADELKIIGHENEKKSLNINDIIKSAAKKKSCSVFTGPEGGFSPEEIQFAEDNGFSFIKLGSRKMRSESAAIIIPSLIFFSL